MRCSIRKALPGGILAGTGANTVQDSLDSSDRHRALSGLRKDDGLLVSSRDGACLAAVLAGQVAIVFASSHSIASVAHIAKGGAFRVVSQASILQDGR